jgi:tocopherol O-methyltransferase
MLKQEIREHYDRVSPLYREFWGLHIHHGYWLDGCESKERAQEQLIDLIADNMDFQPGQQVLDVGCGIGGTAAYLARKFRVNVTGITLSPVQAVMAKDLAESSKTPSCSFAVMDAEQLAVQSDFNVIWSVEALSHMAARNRVLADVTRLLTDRGRIAIADWFKPEELTAEDEARYLDPILRGMLLPELGTMAGYAECLRREGVRITAYADLTSHVSRTWDICTQLTNVVAVTRIAKRYGSQLIPFLRSFHAMKLAFRTGAFRYGLIVGQK